MLKKLLAIAPVLVALCVVFITFSFMPTWVKLIWSALFILAWVSRKLIRENLISWLQTVKNDHLEHILWMDVGSKIDENGKKTHERKPNESSLTAIRLLVSAAIFALFLGIPLVLYWIISAICGFFAGIWNSFVVLGQDLTFVNGVGYFIFALAEILVTLACIGFIVLLIKNSHKFDKRTKRLALLGALLVQRIVSWIYYEYTIPGVLGEIIGWIVLVALLVVAFRHGPAIIAYFKARRTPSAPHPRPSRPESEPIEADFTDVDDADDDSDFKPFG